MYQLTSKLIVYRNMDEGSILFKLADILKEFYGGRYDKEKLVTDIFEQINNILCMATKYGFNKNLWHNYLTFLLAMTENPFTIVSEKVGAVEGTVNEFAKSDFAIFSNCLIMILLNRNKIEHAVFFYNSKL